METLQKEGRFKTEFLATRQSISPPKGLEGLPQARGFRTGKNTIHLISHSNLANDLSISVRCGRLQVSIDTFGMRKHFLLEIAPQKTT